MLGLKDLCVLISCGFLLIIQSSHGSEIIGGKEVKPHSMPFMALLIAKSPACGGILIDPKWVLTAAHCVKIDKVLLGVHSIKEQKKDSWQIRNIEKRFPHPDYNRITRVNDLMLLKLDKPVTKTKEVKCLKLGKAVKDPKAGSSCLVAGWGKTNNNVNKPSNVLMSVNVNVIDRKACNSSDHYNGKPVITSDMICAGSTGDKKAGTCHGDSGGPLLCNKQLVGVTSFGGKVCGEKKQVGVFSFLSKKQLQWIKKTTGGSEI